MRSSILLGMLFLFSCSQYSELMRSNPNLMILKYKNLTIDHLKEIEWNVGKHSKQTISKGFTFRVHFPQLWGDDLAYLTENAKINSFLVRISKIDYKGENVLGRFYIPFISSSKGSSRKKWRQISFALFKIYYGAASLSSRLEKSLCPVMGHNKKLDIYDIVTNLNTYGEKELFIQKIYREPIRGNVQQYSYNLESMNGGSSLIGKYIVEIALVNTENQIRLTKYLLLEKTIEIVKERSIIIKNCHNYNQFY